MEILSLTAIHGPNVYHHRPVIIMKIDLQNFFDFVSDEAPHFNERLLALMPGLKQHECSPGHPGGFCERLVKGTYAAHIIEHIALELSAQAGIGVTFGKTRFTGTKGVYAIVTRFKDENGMKLCLTAAVEVLKHIVKNIPYNIEKALQNIREAVDQNKIGPSTRALLEAAKKRDIPIIALSPRDSLYQLGHGRHRRIIQASITDQTSLIGAEIVQDKELTKKILSRHDIPTPHGILIKRPDELEFIFQIIEPPYAIKPYNGNHGRGITLNLTNLEELKTAFQLAQTHSSAVIVEEMCTGRDYRILVVNGKFVAAAERRPPTVIGDGISNIEQLIAELNKDPQRGEGHDSHLTRVSIDAALLQYLKQQGLNPALVPQKDQVIHLRGNANLSSGGTAKDVTDETHSQIHQICEKIARLFNLNICGIDIIHQNISEPVNNHFKVIEVNAGPGLRMHLAPTEGTPRPVGDAIVQMLFPPGTKATIPLVSVTGTNGKTTVSRLIAKILGMNGSCVGLTTTDGIWVGDAKIVSGDTTGPKSTETILTDPAVDIAVLEVARGGLLRGGLAYDWSDVSVITNIQLDHLGQDGIEDLEDLIWIKSLVAERVRRGGWLVLNADDAATAPLRLKENILRTPKNIFLYSLHKNNLALKDHLAKNGSGCWVEDGWIHLKIKNKFHRLLRVNEIPATLGGAATFQTSNVLAAVAAVSSLDAKPSQIAHGLQSFDPTHENKGRLGLYKIGKGHVILDYAHNPEAIAAIGNLLTKWEGYTTTLVAGLPGDRADELLRQCGSVIMKNFDRVILRDDRDLRGRKPGEVPQLVHDHMKSIAFDTPIEIILNEKDAVDQALRALTENDITVILYDELDFIMNCLQQYNPVPVMRIPPKQIKWAWPNAKTIKDGSVYEIPSA